MFILDVGDDQDSAISLGAAFIRKTDYDLRCSAFVPVKTCRGAIYSLPSLLRVRHMSPRWRRLSLVGEP